MADILAQVAEIAAHEEKRLDIQSLLDNRDPIRLLQLSVELFEAARIVEQAAMNSLSYE